MTDIAENLSLLARRAYEQASPFRVRKVVRVLPTGNGVLVETGANKDGISYGIEVPCLASYVNRQIGDKVMVVTTDERGWLVLGKIGAADDLPAALPEPLPLPIIDPDPSFDVDPQEAS